MKRADILLAKVYENQNIGGYYASEKLDGERCLWDGGASLGIPVCKVPWAKVESTDQRPSTGLWSSYMKPICAPLWWVEKLPRMCLDGELWLGRKRFQELSSIVRRHSPDSRWNDVFYKVFDSPHPVMVGFDKLGDKWTYKHRVKPFSETYNELCNNHHWLVHYQVELPSGNHLAAAKAEQLFEELTKLGAEGLVLRDPSKAWVGKRVPWLLKYKPYIDDEAVVHGYMAGDGKYQGMLGALVVEWKGILFQLSGMTDAERVIELYDASPEPGKCLPDLTKSVKFPIGTVITFRYRELSDSGVPKEARYLRVRKEVV